MVIAVPGSKRRKAQWLLQAFPPGSALGRYLPPALGAGGVGEGIECHVTPYLPIRNSGAARM